MDFLCYEDNIGANDAFQIQADSGRSLMEFGETWWLAYPVRTAHHNLDILGGPHIGAAPPCLPSDKCAHHFF